MLFYFYFLFIVRIKSKDYRIHVFGLEVSPTVGLLSRPLSSLASLTLLLPVEGIYAPPPYPVPFNANNILFNAKNI
jgi:hypothetical protein